MSTVPYLFFYKIAKLQESQLRVREELLPSTTKNHELAKMICTHAYRMIAGARYHSHFIAREFVSSIWMETTRKPHLYTSHRSWLNFLWSLTIIKP